MTEEENKAIEILKEQINFYDANNIKDTNSHKLMNLIEKLQKENEELKNKVVKRDKELIKLEEYANKNFERKDDVKAKYIPKDKIRKLEDMWNNNIWNATDDESKAKAEMIRDVYRGLLNE